MKRVFYSLSLISTLSMLSCGEVSYETASYRYKGPTNRCESNLDCGEGSICDKDLTVCVVSKTVSLGRVYARVTVPGLLPQVFPVDLDASRRYTVELPPPLRLTARVSTDDGFMVSSRIYITDQSGVPSLSPFTVYAAVSESDDADQTMTKAHFTLFEGEHRYRIDAIPVSSATVNLDALPRYFDNVSVVSERGLSNGYFADENGDKLDAFLLTTIQNPNFKGRILRGSQPVDGLSVVLVDSATGRYVSTLGKTGCSSGAVCGEFQIRYSYGDNPVSLKIWNNSDQEYPVTVVPVSTEVSASAAKGEVVEFSLRRLSTPIPFLAAVEKTVSITSSDVPVHDRAQDCRVVFESVVNNDETVESITVNAKTDSMGNIVSLVGSPWLYLYPGEYRITIVPPNIAPESNEDYSLFEDTRQIDTPSANEMFPTVVFILKYRYYSTFRVTAAGVDVPGVEVEAVPLDHGTAYARTSRSAVLEDGSHKIWLDAGRYRLTVKVPYESGYAYSIREIFIDNSDESGTGNPDNVVVAEDTDDPLSKAPIAVPIEDFHLSYPLPAKLHIVASTVSPAGATVEWFEQAADGTTGLIARSFVDEAGDSVGFLPQR